MIRLITRKLKPQKKNISTNEIRKKARKSLAMYLPTPEWIYLSKFSLCKHLNIPNRMYSLCTWQQNPRHLAEICTVATSI
jgi:hypothetical protein